jgi:hypothetical protein
VNGIRRVRALKVVAATAVASLAFASSAYACHGNTWLDWAYLSYNYATQSGFTDTNQAATRPLTNRWGCAELKKSSGRYLFANWYCGTIHEQGVTPGLSGSGVYSAAVAWNDWSKTQQIWAWRCYS